MDFPYSLAATPCVAQSAQKEVLTLSLFHIVFIPLHTTHPTHTTHTTASRGLFFTQYGPARCSRSSPGDARHAENCFGPLHARLHSCMSCPLTQAHAPRFHWTLGTDHVLPHPFSSCAHFLQASRRHQDSDGSKRSSSVPAQHSDSQLLGPLQQPFVCSFLLLLGLRLCL